MTSKAGLKLKRDAARAESERWEENWIRTVGSTKGGVESKRACASSSLTHWKSRGTRTTNLNRPPLVYATGLAVIGEEYAPTLRLVLHLDPALYLPLSICLGKRLGIHTKVLRQTNRVLGRCPHVPFHLAAFPALSARKRNCTPHLQRECAALGSKLDPRLNGTPANASTGG